MDRLTSMAVFKRAVDDGSFAAAARHFGISAEMAGTHVRSLETHLGVRLLNRSTRRLHLTEVGSSYYARCTSILAEPKQRQDRSRQRPVVCCGSPLLSPSALDTSRR